MKHKLIKHLHTFKHLRYLDLPTDIRPKLFYKIMTGIAKSCRKVEYIRLYSHDAVPDFIETALAVESLKELEVVVHKLTWRGERKKRMRRKSRVAIPFDSHDSYEILYRWKRGSNQKFVLKCYS